MRDKSEKELKPSREALRDADPKKQASLWMQQREAELQRDNWRVFYPTFFELREKEYIEWRDRQEGAE